MKKTYKNILKYFLLFSLILSCFSVTAFAEASVATISSYSGSVYVKKSGGEKKISAFKGMRFKKGDTIITGKKSSATLDIDSDKEVIVGDNTQLSITELSKELAKNSSKSSFTLQAGKVWSNVKKKLNKDSKFQIKTSTTIAGVRGTKFYVSQEEGKTEIAVLEGTVAAETVMTAKQPDGTYDTEKIEKIIEKNEQLQVNDTIQDKDEIIQQPVQLETLNTFVLESYKNSIIESNPELVDDLNKIIEEKKAEEEKKDESNSDNEEKAPPKVSYDPVVAPETPTNIDNTGYNPPPDPVPNSAPTAINLSISGNPKIGDTLMGIYTYSDSDNDVEGTSTFRWYRGTSVDGLDKTEIAGATSQSYTLTELDLGKYIFFEVTPVATSGIVSGQAAYCVLASPIVSLDTTPPIGTILNSFLSSEGTIIIQFNEALHADTLALTTPSALILNSSIEITNIETTENVNVEGVQWYYAENMVNNPLLILYLEDSISLYSQDSIQVQFNENVIKDINGNIYNDIIIGKIINDGNGYIPTISGTENLCENTINSDGAILTITLGTEQGNWVEDIISDTSKLNKLYNSFYTDSNYDQWTKLRDGFTATLVNDTTLDLTIPSEPNYNIDKNQWVILVIPGELVSSNLSALSMPFEIHAEPAEQLKINNEYSYPVPGTGDSEGSYGTTKIETLNNNSILGATKWQVKVLDYNDFYNYETIPYDSIIEGAVDYIQGEDIQALPSQNLLLLATDNEGKVKKYALIYLVPIPQVENFSFDNSDPEVKNVIIQGNKFSDYYGKLEVITISPLDIPNDSSTAEYELYQLYQGTQPLTPLENATTISGDTVYYRFVNGQLKSPWVADGIVTYDEVKPKNSNSNAENIRFILSASEKKVKIKAINGVFAAVIINCDMLPAVAIPENGSLDISIDDGINYYDEIAVAILNEDGNIAAKSNVVQAPSKMYNHIYYNRFTILGNKGEISLNSNYKGSINIFINGTLITSSNIQKNYDTYVSIANGLTSGDKIQVQLIDEFGNESEISDEVMVMEAPNINDIQLNFGTDSDQDSITINNLEIFNFDKITIVDAINNQVCYEFILDPSVVTGIEPLTFNLDSSIAGTTGSTYKIYFSDFYGNTSPSMEIQAQPTSEIITAQ